MNFAIDRNVGLARILDLSNEGYGYVFNKIEYKIILPDGRIFDQKKLDEEISSILEYDSVLFKAKEYLNILQALKI